MVFSCMSYGELRRAGSFAVRVMRWLAGVWFMLGLLCARFMGLSRSWLAARCHCFVSQDKHLLSPSIDHFSHQTKAKRLWIDYEHTVSVIVYVYILYIYLQLCIYVFIYLFVSPECFFTTFLHNAPLHIPLHLHGVPSQYSSRVSHYKLSAVFFLIFSMCFHFFIFMQVWLHEHCSHWVVKTLSRSWPSMNHCCLYTQQWQDRTNDSCQKGIHQTWHHHLSTRTRHSSSIFQVYRPWRQLRSFALGRSRHRFFFSAWTALLKGCEANLWPASLCWLWIRQSRRLHFFFRGNHSAETGFSLSLRLWWGRLPNSRRFLRCTLGVVWGV